MILKSSNLLTKQSGDIYMASDALKMFGMIMDDTSEIKNIVINNFFKSLELGDNDSLNLFVQEKISDLDFCIVEDKFILRIQELIDNEFKKIENSNQPIDWEQFEINLKNGLQQIKMDDIRLEDDINTLSLQISDKFPMISREVAYEKLSKKQEMLENSILSTNKSIIDTLVNLTPQLVTNLKELQNVETLKNDKTEIVLEQPEKSPIVNLHDAIENVRQSLYTKAYKIVASSKSENPFKEVNPITIKEFEQELEKYNVSVDKSYIKGIVYELNMELARQLIDKTKTNILHNIISLSNFPINLLNNDDLIKKYGINLDDKYMNEIKEYVNNGIKNENDLFKQYPGYKSLYECFIDLASTDIQKEAIEQIMKNGGYNGFKLNSMLSNERDKKYVEMKRRISFAEMILHDENLFFYLANNGLNVFHGTKIEALQTILSKGLFSSSELNERGIKLKTGEELAMNQNYGGNIEKRSFISLTDDFDTSVSYAGFYYEEYIEFIKKFLGIDLNSDSEIPIIVCLNGNNIEEQYSDSLVTVKSTCNEIGVNSSISPSNIKCIITSYDNVDYVKKLTSDYRIKVLGYNYNDKFEKRLNIDKEDKFYSFSYNKIIINEEKFANCKKAIKEKLNKTKVNIPSTNNVSNAVLLNDDLSMKIASDVKMDIVFDLIEQYYKEIPVVPLTAKDLMTKYNINEKVAKQLSSDINEMVFGYIESKEKRKMNDCPYNLDGFEENSPKR